MNAFERGKRARVESAMRLPSLSQTRTSAFLIFFACFALSSGPRLSMIRAADMVLLVAVPPERARLQRCRARAMAGGSVFGGLIAVLKLHLDC